MITAGSHAYDTWVVEDVATLSSLDRFMARFAHFSPDAPQVALTIKESSFAFAAKSFKEITTFIEMDPKPYTLELRAVDDGHLILTKSFSPIPGSFYTISLVGFQTPPANNTNQLDLLIVKSQ